MTQDSRCLSGDGGEKIAGHIHALNPCFPDICQLWAPHLEPQFPFWGKQSQSSSFPALILFAICIKILICKACVRAANSNMIVCYGININLVKCIVRFDVEDIFIIIRTGTVNRFLLELSH